MIVETSVNLKNKNKDELIALLNDSLKVIQTQQEEIEAYKDIKELAGIEIREILNWKYENKRLKSEIEKKDKWINKLETKLMYALTPTKHELAKRTQEEFKRVIRENIDEDTYTIKRKLKEEWNNL